VYRLTNKETSCNSKVVLGYGIYRIDVSSWYECILYAPNAVSNSFHPTCMTMASAGDWKFIFWTVINTIPGAVVAVLLFWHHLQIFLLTYLLTYLL